MHIHFDTVFLFLSCTERCESDVARFLGHVSDVRAHAIFRLILIRYVPRVWALLIPELRIRCAVQTSTRFVLDRLHVVLVVTRTKSLYEISLVRMHFCNSIHGQRLVELLRSVEGCHDAYFFLMLQRRHIYYFLF